MWESTLEVTFIIISGPLHLLILRWGNAAEHVRARIPHDDPLLDPGQEHSDHSAD